ncbi:MAG: PQQ-binding-like beta-propeller repeat protein [Acidobacteria bacterium]|nr:PQQ-binding-like beta-propeller repeat protein [Acidobacteriota bacterium]
MIPRILLTLLLIVPVFFAAPEKRKNENWPQFRGANSMGVAEEDSTLPDKWSATENVVWKADIAGTGWSSPIVWGDKVFVTSVVSTGQTEVPKKGLYFGGERYDLPQNDHRWVVYCLDFKTGKTLWEREVFKGAPKMPHHLKNTYASETPATDGERIYALFGNVGLFCFDMAGKPLWQQLYEPRKTRFGWGTAASPVVYKDRVYVVNDNDEQSFLAAYDKKTGKQIWKADREIGTNWVTPYIWENKQRTELIVPATKVVRSYDLDGKVLWEYKGMSSIVIPTPFSKFDLLYISSGYVGDQHRPVYAIRPGATGDISLKQGETSNQYIAWYLPQGGPYNPTPIIYGDIYYTLYDRGFFTANDARTGKEVYGKNRFDPAAGAFTSSPWAYNGKIFCLSEDGDTFVVQAGPEFKLVGKNSLDEMCMATPAIVRGSLLIRTATKLYKIAKKV